MRAGFLKGTLRHLRSLPRLVASVRGWPLLAADCTGLRRRPYRLRTRAGAECELRPGTSDWWIFLEIFVFGIYDRVREEIAAAEVILDVGANVGLFSIYASALNPRVTIHAFEPFPPNFEQLKRNLLLNPNHRVRVHPEAVSDKTGKAQLGFTPGDDSGCSLAQAGTQSCPVNTISSRELLSGCNVDRCDVLKLDCEGSELPLLSACPEMLAKTGAVIMEYHNPAEVDALRGLLEHAGLNCEVLQEIHTLYASRG